jgi:hypothetical protein
MRAAGYGGWGATAILPPATAVHKIGMGAVADSACRIDERRAPC